MLVVEPPAVPLPGPANHGRPVLPELAGGNDEVEAPFEQRPFASEAPDERLVVERETPDGIAVGLRRDVRTEAGQVWFDVGGQDADEHLHRVAERV